MAIDFSQIFPFLKKRNEGATSGFIDPRTYGGTPNPNVMYATGNGQHAPGLTMPPPGLPQADSERPVGVLPPPREISAPFTFPTVAAPDITPSNYGLPPMPAPQPVNGNPSPLTPSSTVTPSPLADYQRQLAEIQGKQYGIGGKDRASKHDWKRALALAGMRALQGFAKGGIGGAIFGAGQGTVEGVADRDAWSKFKDERNKAKLLQKIGNQQQIDAKNAEIERTKAQTQTIYTDDERDKAKVDIAWQKLLDAQEFNDWKMKHGDEKLSDEANFRKWKMERGDKDANNLEVYRKFQREKAEADRELRLKGYDTQIRVAETAARSREKVAGINQEGQTTRNNAQIAARTEAQQKAMLYNIAVEGRNLGKTEEEIKAMQDKWLEQNRQLLRQGKP